MICDLVSVDDTLHQAGCLMNVIESKRINIEMCRGRLRFFVRYIALGHATHYVRRAALPHSKISSNTSP